MKQLELTLRYAWQTTSKRPLCRMRNAWKAQPMPWGGCGHMLCGKHVTLDELRRMSTPPKPSQRKKRKTNGSK